MHGIKIEENEMEQQRFHGQQSTSELYLVILV